MAWETDEVKEILRHLGEIETLWLLAIIEKRVGTGKAHHYRVFPGKIQSISKDYDIDPVNRGEISSAFNRLKRVEIGIPNGQSGSIILGDKEDYVKLTNLGLTLVTKIDNSSEIIQFIEEFLGGTSPEDSDWFPADNPPEAPIKLSATSEPPDDDAERYDVEAVAEFECPYPDCDGTIEHSYSFTHPDETWLSRVQADCPSCGEIWEHVVGAAYQEPTKPDV